MNSTSVDELECEAWDFFSDHGVTRAEDISRKGFLKRLLTIMKDQEYYFMGRTESVTALIEECRSLGMPAAAKYFNSRVVETEEPFINVRPL